MIKSLLRFLLAALSGVDIKVAWFMRDMHEGRRYDLASQFKIKNSRLILKPNGNSISNTSVSRYSSYLTHLYDLLRYDGFKDEKGVFTFSASFGRDLLRFQFINYGNIFAYQEIFENSMYQLVFPEGKSTVVFDVGMNIGLASLYFATQSDVKKIYGFELIPTTYDLAKRNIASNSFAVDKCEPFNIGWSNRNYSIHVPNHFEGSVSVSLVEIEENATVNGTLVEVRDASEVVRSLVDVSLSDRYILKLDCEGAEYDIITSLADSFSLKYFDAIIIEWHSRGDNDLVKMLMQAGFNLTSFTSKEYSGSTGLIYAFKK